MILFDYTRWHGYHGAVQLVGVEAEEDEGKVEAEGLGQGVLVTGAVKEVEMWDMGS